jgi:uncharacterized protein (DUF362 family)
MASRSATAMDFVATTIIGMDPLSVPTAEGVERATAPVLDEIAHGESVACDYQNFKKARLWTCLACPGTAVS